MNYQTNYIAPNEQYPSASLDADKTFNAQPVMITSFSPTSPNQFTHAPTWDCDMQQPPMLQVQFLPQCPPHPAIVPLSVPVQQQVMRPRSPNVPMYPSLSPLPDPIMPLSVPVQHMPLSPISDHCAPMTIHEQVMTPQSPNVPMFVFSTPAYNQYPLQQQFANMQVMTPPQFFARPSNSVSPPRMMEDPRRHNRRTPPGFDKQDLRAFGRTSSRTPSRSPPKERKPLQTRLQNQSENPRRRNPKRKSKKQQEKLADSGYRPSYRSKQDMIDKVFLALSGKYTALGLLENKGLRGDDTIRVHVKNFKALTRIEEALIAVESHPKVEISRVSLPFSFRNEFQKKGFLVYLKFKDVTMVPHAQSAFRQYDEFKKCGVMRETGQYVESLPLTQATKPTFSEPATPEWNPALEEKESTPDYASGTESSSSTEIAQSDSEQFSKSTIGESFGPFTALASTRSAMSRPASANNLTVHALMRVDRWTNIQHEKTAGKCCFDCASVSFGELQQLPLAEAS